MTSFCFVVHGNTNPLELEDSAEVYGGEERVMLQLFD